MIFGSTYRLDLVLVEVGNEVEKDPRNAAAEVDYLVHDEAHDARREDIVLHPDIPGLRRNRVSICSIGVVMKRRHIRPRGARRR